MLSFASLTRNFIWLLVNHEILPRLMLQRGCRIRMSQRSKRTLCKTQPMLHIHIWSTRTSPETGNQTFLAAPAKIHKSRDA